jgi:TPR repeat protein
MRNCWAVVTTLIVFLLCACSHAAAQTQCETAPDPQRQYEIAIRLAQVSQEVAARRCLELAARAGLPEAQLELGRYDLAGKGGAGGALPAFEWLERAAANGSQAARDLRQSMGGGLANTSELKRSARKASAHPSSLYFLLPLLPVLWLWLAIGNRSPWPWRWTGRRPGDVR